MSYDSFPAIDSRSDVSVVAKAFFRLSVPGLVVAALLFIIDRWSGLPGVANAVSSLTHEILNIHPFILSFAALLVTAPVFLQNADINAELDRIVIFPALVFLSHNFAIALGMLLPLAVLKELSVESHECLAGHIAGYSAYGLLIALVGLMAFFGMIIIRSRIRGREMEKGAVETPEKTENASGDRKASKVQVWMFGILGAFSFAFAVGSARLSENSGAFWEHILQNIQGYVCR